MKNKKLSWYTLARIREIISDVYIEGMKTSEKNRKEIVIYPKDLAKYIHLKICEIVEIFKDFS